MIDEKNISASSELSETIISVTQVLFVYMIDYKCLVGICTVRNWEINGREFSLSPYAAENLVSRQRLGRPVPRQHVLYQTTGYITCLRT